MHSQSVACNTITFKTLDVGSSYSDMPYRIRVKFAYKCHRVKVLIRGWSCLRFESILVYSIFSFAKMLNPVVYIASFPFCRIFLRQTMEDCVYYVNAYLRSVKS